MLYFFLQFVVLLLIAVALGLVVGWMLWGRMVEYLQHATDVESTKFHTRVADLSNEVKFRAAEIGRLQSDLAKALSDEAAMRAELEEARSAELDLLAQVGARERELSELRDAVALGGGANEQLERALAECRAARRAAEGELSRLRSAQTTGESMLPGGAS